MVDWDQTRTQILSATVGDMEVGLAVHAVSERTIKFTSVHQHRLIGAAGPPYSSI